MALAQLGAIAQLGLGGGCVPGNVPGECMYGNMSISCSLIRECDSQTGNKHWEYGLPGSTGNVNMPIANLQGQIVGYTDENGNYINTPPPATKKITNVNQLPQTLIQQALDIARNEGIRKYPLNAQSQALYIATRYSQILTNQVNKINANPSDQSLMSRLDVSPEPSTNNSQVTGYVNVNTPTVTSGSTTSTSVTASNTNSNSTITPPVSAIQSWNFSNMLSSGWDKAENLFGDNAKWVVSGAGLIALWFMFKRR